MQNKHVTATKTPKRLACRLILILAMMLVVTAIVYLAGGTKSALPHLMYVPIALSAYYFGPVGAACAAVLGALMLGPWMPLNVAACQMQSTLSWIFRLIIFCGIGLFFSLLFRHVKAGRNAQTQRLYMSLFTSLPNLNRLREDLDNLIAAGMPFTVLGFHISNFDEINRFTSYDTGIEAMKRVGKMLRELSGSTVYSALNDEFMIILPGAEPHAALKTGQNLLEGITAPLKVDRYTMRLQSKCGFAIYPDHAQTSQELLRMVGMALSLGKEHMGVYSYSCQLEQQSRKRQEVVSALFEAVKKDEFYMVYQPKLQLQDNSIPCVEALLRWERGMQMKIDTTEFIEIAEEAGLISDITKRVIVNVVRQAKAWYDQGIPIKTAMNVAPQDLHNPSVINTLIETIKALGVPPELIEIEVTERGIMENDEWARTLLNYLKSQGIYVALDDFGAGCTCLLNLMDLPFDFVKIDKAFIGSLSQDNFRYLVEEIISFAHKTGKKVVAEGVEEADQFEILRAMDCDFIQGLYLSAPLLPEDLVAFISRHRPAPEGGAPAPEAPESVWFEV